LPLQSESAAKVQPALTRTLAATVPQDSSKMTRVTPPNAALIFATMGRL